MHSSSCVTWISKDYYHAVTFIFCVCFLAALIFSFCALWVVKITHCIIERKMALELLLLPPLITLAPASSASPSSTHSHRGWGMTAGPCRSIYSQIRSSLSPLCRSLPLVHCHCAAASRRPCSGDAWCTCSGSRSPLMSFGPAQSLRRSGRGNKNITTCDSKVIFCCCHYSVHWCVSQNIWAGTFVVEGHQAA